MKHINVLVLILVIGVSANGQQNRSDDSEKLKQVLQNYFAGIGTRDTKKMTAVTTNDFLVYEEGKVWNNDSVFKEMERFPYNTANFTFDNFRINVDNSSAYMSYLEHAQFLMKDSTVHNLYFLGSAAFKKSEEGWKMSFLHSTDKYVPKKK